MLSHAIAGTFQFAPPPSGWHAADCGQPGSGSGGGAGKARHRVRYEGMFNGRPRGRGVLRWSDGSQVGAGGCMHAGGRLALSH